MRKLTKILLIALGIFGLTSTAYATQITVPSAPGAGYCLKSIANGTYTPLILNCSSGGGGTGVSPWSTTTSQVPIWLINFSNNATDIVTVGGSATSTAKFIFDPNSQIGYFSGSVGIGTKSPVTQLDIRGGLNVTASSTIGTLHLGNPLEITSGGTARTTVGASSTVSVSDGTNYQFYKLSPALFTTANVSQWTNDANYLTGNQTVTLTGDVTGSGATAITTTYNNSIPVNKGGTGATAVGASSTAALSDGSKLVYYKLSPALFTTANVSQWTNDSAYLTLATLPFTYPFPAGATSSLVTFNGGATIANSLTLSGITGSTQCLSANSSGVVSGTGSACGAGGGSTYPWPFGLAGNATSTLTQFNGGLTSYASTTVGNGTTAGGLVINGTATSTGNMYVAGSLGVGTTLPSEKLTVSGAGGTRILLTDSSSFAALRINSSGDTASLDYAHGGVSKWGSGLNGSSDSYNIWDASLSNQNIITIPQGAGKVGFGSSSPTQILSVQGNALISGDITSVANITATGTLTLSAITGTQCLHAVNGAVSGTGADCGSGGSSLAWPWLPTTNYNQAANSTTTQMWLRGSPISLSASSTAEFAYASTTQLTLLGPVYDSTNSAGTGGYTLMSRGNGVSPQWVASTTYNSPLSFSNGAVSLSTSGTWSGNAGTATALAANGTNCSAGNYPLGVDASGNSENCTAANTGTVTSVATNNGLTGGTITTSGTIGLDLTKLVSGALTFWNGSQLQATGTQQLTVGNLLATSTTATSTFAGGITGPGSFAVLSASGWVGIGTSSPMTGFASAAATNTFAGDMDIGATTASTSITIDRQGHMFTGGPMPVCTSGCATGPSLWGDDSTFRILLGSTITSATITFANTWVNSRSQSVSPACTPTDESGVTTGIEASSTPTTVVLSLPTALTTKMVTVQCKASDNFIF